MEQPHIFQMYPIFHKLECTFLYKSINDPSQKMGNTISFLFSITIFLDLHSTLDYPRGLYGLRIIHAQS